MIQTLRHHFDHCSVQQCERLFFVNQQFNEEAATRARMVSKLAKLTVNRQPLSRSDAYHGAPSIPMGSDITIERVSDFESNRKIKGSLQKYFTAGDVKYRETLNYKTRDHKGSLTIAPAINACTVEGNIALQPNKDGVDRVLTLDVKMRKRWFFIKWIAEPYILKSVAHSYEEIHSYTQECLRKSAQA